MTKITSDLTIQAQKIDILLNAQNRLNDYSDYCTLDLKIDNRFLAKVLKNAIDSALKEHKAEIYKLVQDFTKEEDRES